MDYQYHRDNKLEESKTGQTLSEIKKAIERIYLHRIELGRLTKTSMELQSASRDDDWTMDFQGTQFEIEELVKYFYYEDHVSWKDVQTLLPIKGLQIREKNTKDEYVIAHVDQYRTFLTICSRTGEVKDIDKSKLYSDFEKI